MRLQNLAPKEDLINLCPNGKKFALNIYGNPPLKYSFCFGKIILRDFYNGYYKSMQNTPLVSIIIPAYNSEKYVEKAIESAVDQSYKNTEIIIIEDGSTDNTSSIVEKWKNHSRVSVLEHPRGMNMGVSRTRKLGIDHAKGEYIAFLDADDIFFEDKIGKQIEIFNHNKDVVLVHGSAKVINETDLNFNNEFSYEIENIPYSYSEQSNWLQNNHICNSTVMIRARDIKNLNFGFPQAFQFEDWLMWSLLSLKGKFYFLNEPLSYYRFHENSATANILKQDLLSGYSKIEYLLTFFLAIDSEDYLNKRIIVTNIKETLVQLLRRYEKSERWVEFDRQWKIGESENETEKKYYDLLTSYEKLNLEYRKISRLKHSKIYKLLNYFNGRTKF